MLQARRKPWQDDCVGTKARSSRYSQHKKTILGSFSRLLSCCSCDQGREDVDRIGSGIRCPSVTGRCLLANTEKRTRSSNGANKCVRARPGCRRSPETDAPDRQAAHGIPMHGRPAVAGSAGPESLKVGPLHVATLMELMGRAARVRAHPRGRPSIANRLP